MVQIDASSLRNSKWHEYVIRFLFGGLVTVLAGEVAKHYGASLGGLFLAFPSILPATLTLAAKHERQKKESRGMAGTERGKDAASSEAAGTTMGSIGLLVFAAVVWWGMPRWPAWTVLLLATTSWLLGSVTVWWLRKRS